MTDLAMWTVYDHPKDYPDHFIARKWLVGSKRAEPEATDEVIARLLCMRYVHCLPPGLYCLARNEEDDPVVVETLALKGKNDYLLKLGSDFFTCCAICL